jgi:hypothetical protein
MLADVDDDPWDMCGRGIRTGCIAMAVDHVLTRSDDEFRNSSVRLLHRTNRLSTNMDRLRQPSGIRMASRADS